MPPSAAPVETSPPRAGPRGLAPDDSAFVARFVGLAGDAAWRKRMAEIGRRTALPSLEARALGERHALELALHRLSAPGARLGGAAERRLAALAREAVRLAASLPTAARVRLRDRLRAGLSGEGNLVSLFHLLRVACLHRGRGFDVAFTGLAEGTPHDLVIRREGIEAEIACETLSAEEGRALPRTGFRALMDGINPDLQVWLAAHPGRYVLKVTLPEGQRGDALALQQRILGMLKDQRRQDSAADAVLKLDPLILAGAAAARPTEALREIFGPEAHLAVTQGNGNMMVLAARAAEANGVAEALCRRLDEASARLSGTRPGVLACFLDDIGRDEWREMRSRRTLEGMVRRFLATGAARSISTISCTTRMELAGLAPPDSAPDGEIRIRHPGPARKGQSALDPALSSTG